MALVGDSPFWLHLFWIHPSLPLLLRRIGIGKSRNMHQKRGNSMIVQQHGKLMTSAVHVMGIPNTA